MSARIPAGAYVMTFAEMRILHQVAQLGEVQIRLRERGKDTVEYRVVREFTDAMYAGLSDLGKEPRQPTETGEREYWTTKQLATATGRSDRTIRLHCENGDLPATRLEGGPWIITRADAETYIARKKQN